MARHEKAEDFVKQQTPLLAPKLQAPRLHSTLVRRERLLALLDRSRERKLTLITAPAGFGKTTLARQWVAEHEGDSLFPPVAWVLLDAGDNDPVRFWRYVVTACETFQPGLGRVVLPLLEAAVQPFKQSPLENALTALLNELTGNTNGGILALEDYHLITNTQIHETVSFLLEHLPATLHLLIISRGAPPLPLAQLRASGELGEALTADLRFTPAEALAFLQQASHSEVSAELLAPVEARLEGWAAGLRVLSLALEGARDKSAAERIFAQFAVGARSLQEYFVVEVLNAQPEQQQNFLLQTSFLPALTGPLCDALTNRDDGEQVLETLERNNLFVEPLDGAGVWYRYHALFAAAMQQEAKRRLGAARLGELAQKAGRWYEQHDMPVQAVEAAFQAQDFNHAAELIERLYNRRHLNGAQELMLTPGLHTLREWVERLPAAVLDQRPILYLAHASAVLYSFFLDLYSAKPMAADLIEASLQKAERSLREQSNNALLGEVYAFRAMLTRQQGDFDAAAMWGAKALADLPTDDLMSRSLSLNSRGCAELASGNLERAIAFFSEAKNLCEVAGNRTYFRANNGIMSWAMVEQGKLHEAATQFREMSAEAYAVDDVDDIIHSQYALAEIDYEWNNLAEAQQHAETALAASRQLVHERDSFVGATLVLARIAQARGQNQVAADYFARLLDSGSVNSAPERELLRRTLSDQAVYWIMTGDLAAAQRWANALDPNEPLMPLAQLQREERVVARLLIAQDKAGEALDLLQTCLEYARERGRKRDEQEALALMALAHAALKQAPASRQKLQTALEMARSENFMRLFLDEGPALIALLQSLLPDLHEKPLVAYARAIINASSSEQAARGQASGPQLDPLVEPLSKQEKRVLQLLAAGRTNPEIAEELVVSVNTIKAQVKSIYRKLNVSDRQEASRAAQAIGLV